MSKTPSTDTRHLKKSALGWHLPLGSLLGTSLVGSVSGPSLVTVLDTADRLLHKRPHKKGYQSTERDGWGILGIPSCCRRAQVPQTCSTTSPSVGAYRGQFEPCKCYSGHGPCLPAASLRFFDQIGEIRIHFRTLGRSDGLPRRWPQGEMGYGFWSRSGQT